jgi:hypothetical protein
MRTPLIALAFLAASSLPAWAQICDNATIILQDRFPDTYEGQVFNGVAHETAIRGNGAILMQQTKPENLLAYPFRIENSGNNRACARNFAVLNTNPIDQSWSDSKNVNNAGISFNGGRLVLEDARFYGTHDAIRPSKGRPGETGKGAFEIRRVWVGHLEPRRLHRKRSQTIRRDRGFPVRWLLYLHFIAPEGKPRWTSRAGNGQEQYHPARPYAGTL